MEDERDYYAILGVPANAPDAEIRRAFRARAKELHPDSKPASERDQAHREFNILTEAYDTLKDAERRAAYDEELRDSRQLTRVEAKGKPPGAFAMGLTFGLLLAGAGDRRKAVFGSAGRSTPKSQDSLRVTRVQPQPPAPAPAPSVEMGQAAPAGAAAPYPTDDGSPRLAPAPEPGEPSAARDRSRVALQEPGPAASGLLPPPRVTAALPMDQPPGKRGPRAPNLPGMYFRWKARRVRTRAASSVYRLVSLVNSWTAIEELSEAAALASRPETANLIWERIAALKEEQARQLASSARPQEPVASPRQPSGRGQPLEAGRHLGCGNRRPGGRDDFEVASRRRLEGEFLGLLKLPRNGYGSGRADAHRLAPGKRRLSAGGRPRAQNYHSEAVCGLEARHFGGELAGLRRCRDMPADPGLIPVRRAGVPATRVSWFDAKTYVEWLSKSSGRRYRLLSEAEWEYVAHAGKAADSGLKLDSPAGRGGVSGVLRLGGPGLKQLGETKPNGWGVHPLPANLLEWVEDCWHPNYAQSPQDGAPWLSGGGGDCAYRVVRGVAAAAGSSAAGGLRGEPGSPRMRARQPLDSASRGTSTCCPGPRSTHRAPMAAGRREGNSRPAARLPRRRLHRSGFAPVHPGSRLRPNERRHRDVPGYCPQAFPG